MQKVDRVAGVSYIYIYYYAEAAITLYTNKLYTHTSRIKPNYALYPIIFNTYLYI